MKIFKKEVKKEVIIKKGASRIVSVTVAVIFISFLIASGPAEAFVLGLNLPQPYVKLGEKTTFSVSTSIEEGEELQIDRLKVELIGPETISCEFLADGTPISECKSMKINMLSNGTVKPEDCYGYDSGNCNGEYGYDDEGYGHDTDFYNYGYGYEPKYIKGVLKYNVEFDTKGHKPGVYTISYTMNVSGSEFKKEGEVLFVYEKPFLEGCSVRADKGIIEEASLGKSENGRTRISFNFPSKNAVVSVGSLQSQAANKRLSYSFDVVGVLENNEQFAKILIRGSYRVGIKDSKDETSIIYLDKESKKMTLTGKGLTVSNMDVTFMQNCG